MAGDVLEANKATAIRFYTQVFGGHDPDIAADYLVPDVVFHVAGRRLDGAGEWKAFAAEWVRGFPDTEMEVDFAMAEDDRVLIHWRATGTHEGEFHGRAPTGRRLAASGVVLFRLAGGRIEEIWDQTEVFGDAEPFTIV